MTERSSLPAPCSSQIENDNNQNNTHEHILPPPISFSAIENHSRPNTWPSYFQSTVVRLFLTKPIISLPSFLRQDTWSLSSLSDEEQQQEDDDIEQMKRKSTVSSSLHFPAVPTILWHLHDKKKSTRRLYLPRLDLESPTTTLFPEYYKTNGTDIPRHCSSSIKTFHTQSILFLFGFIFFPCWWYGWYLSTAVHSQENGRKQNSACCCMHHYQPHYNHQLNRDHYQNNINDTDCCAYPVVTSLYHDIYCYSRFNRFLSFVSFFLLLLILGLLIWLYWGTTHRLWN